MERSEYSAAEPMLRLLGRFSLARPDRDAVPLGMRSRALLAVLACNAGKPCSRERLIGLLWAERFEEQARQSLRQALSTLRKTLGPEMIDADREQVCLAQSFSSDVSHFLALIETGSRDDLTKAVELYEDDLLSGFSLEETPFMEWLARERTRLRDIALGALDSLMEQADTGPEELLALAQRAVTIDPYRERAHRHLLRALALMGRRSDALAHYREVEQRLRRDLGIEPEAATQEILESVRSGSIVAREGQTAGPSLANQPRSASTPAETRPGIAVLPFDAIGGDATASRLADGITEDIITDLARFRGLDVIARNSTAVYKGKAVDVRKIGRDLGIRYVLEGSIQRQSAQIRATAQLIDASTGMTVWSDRWDRPDGDVFAVQTEVAEKVAVTLGGMGGSAAITAEEIRKARRRSPESLTAYDYYLLANEGRTRFTRESISRGLTAATTAISLEPTLGRAYVARAWLNYIAVHYGADFEQAMQAMEADAKHALELDPYDAEARITLAFYLCGRGRFEECEVQIRAALQANPSNAQVLVVAAAALAWCGRPGEGAELADKVTRLDPWMTAENLNCIKDAYFYARRFQDVIAVVSRIPRDARGRGSWLLLTLSYALLGRLADAAVARQELLSAYPSISAEQLLNQDWLLARPEEERLLLDGFRAADLTLSASEGDLTRVTNARRAPGRAAPMPGG